MPFPFLEPKKKVLSDIPRTDSKKMVVEKSDSTTEFGVQCCLNADGPIKIYNKMIEVWYKT